MASGCQAARDNGSVPTLQTIGVYGFDRGSFLTALGDAEVELLLDVRQRRGVRGSEYAWANAQRLRAALAEAGVAYEHLKELAPTTEMRQLQYAEDARRGEGKRSRTVLAPAYVERYTEEVLDRVDLAPILRWIGKQRAALLCVERDPEACHRSLIAARLRRARLRGRAPAPVGVAAEVMRPRRGKSSAADQLIERAITRRWISFVPS
jgi:uncharacterized protein (DUF488 family)